MPLETVVDNLEGVEEKYKDLYIKNSDGKFEVNITGLKSALTKERGLKKDFETKYNKLNNVDTPPDLDEMTLQLKEAKDTITNMKVKGKVKTAAIKAGIDPDYVDDVVLLTKGKFKVGDNGEITDKDGDTIDINGYFKNNFKKAKPRYYVSSGRKGSGAVGSDTAPVSYDGKVNKAIKSGDITSLVKLKQSKIK